MNDNYDDFAFNEIKAILDRRYQHRIRVARRFLIGLVISFLTVFAGAIAINVNYRLMSGGWIDSDQVKQYHDLIFGAFFLIVFLLSAWFGLSLLDMVVGGAKDRALRKEIDKEREWRIRQWQYNGYDNMNPYAYEDDGEIEYTAKRKRMEE